MYRDLIAWCFGLMALITLAVLLPWGLGDKADPLASAPLGIKPEWYFLPLFQSLKLAPATIFSLAGELVVNLLVGVLCVVWVMIPFLDRRASQGRKSTLFTLFGIALIVYIILTITLAYTSS
jgi:cytochrome b6